MNSAYDQQGQQAIEILLNPDLIQNREARYQIYLHQHIYEIGVQFTFERISKTSGNERLARTVGSV